MTSTIEVSEQEVETYRESLEAEKLIDFRKEMVQARIQYAEKGSDEARHAYVFYLMKSASTLDLNNAKFHLLEMLADEPLSRNMLYQLALVHYKLGENEQACEYLANLFDIPPDTPPARDAPVSDEMHQLPPSALDRKAACLQRVCERAQRRKTIVTGVVGGATLTAGLAGLALAAFAVTRALKK